MSLPGQRKQDATPDLDVSAKIDYTQAFQQPQE
jgi:hypothetical protein